MNKQKLLVLVTVLGLIAGTAMVLNYYAGHARLGRPGVKTRPLAGSANLEVLLPEQVLDYASQPLPLDPGTVAFLPKDTSYGRRYYRGPDGGELIMDVVLMGADRTSLHKPQICMPGQGLTIEKTEIINIPVSAPHAYELPVIKLSYQKADSRFPGQTRRGVFLYWFVADGALSADVTAMRRMWLSSAHLFRTGELQRWAYVVCYGEYLGGDEAPSLERMKRFLADAVPQFQTTTGPAAGTTTVSTR